MSKVYVEIEVDLLREVVEHLIEAENPSIKYDENIETMTRSANKIRKREIQAARSKIEKFTIRVPK